MSIVVKKRFPRFKDMTEAGECWCCCWCYCWCCCWCYWCYCLCCWYFCRFFTWYCCYWAPLPSPSIHTNTTSNYILTPFNSSCTPSQHHLLSTLSFLFILTLTNSFFPSRTHSNRFLPTTLPTPPPIQGFMTRDEQTILENIKTPHNKYFVPLAWAANIVQKARSEEVMKEDYGVKSLLDVRGFFVVFISLFNF